MSDVSELICNLSAFSGCMSVCIPYSSRSLHVSVGVCVCPVCQCVRVYERESGVGGGRERGKREGERESILILMTKSLPSIVVSFSIDIESLTTNYSLPRNPHPLSRINFHEKAVPQYGAHD